VRGEQPVTSGVTEAAFDAATRKESIEWCGSGRRCIPSNEFFVEVPTRNLRGASKGQIGQSLYRPTQPRSRSQCRTTSSMTCSTNVDVM
jgi:hypothetical protein